jgi:hypothetical protein
MCRTFLLGPFIRDFFSYQTPWLLAFNGYKYKSGGDMQRTVHTVDPDQHNSKPTCRDPVYLMAAPSCGCAVDIYHTHKGGHI